MPAIGPNYRKLVTASTISNLGDGVGFIAYPWLASVVTRNPLLIALVGVAQRLPWLLLTLPAGVVADRVDRHRIMVAANTVRAVLTLLVAFAILGSGSDLPGPNQLELVLETDRLLYFLVLVATLLLGTAEVFHDNAAQSFLPTIVAEEHLAKANGRLYAAENVSNQFLGPPLGSLLLAAGFALPFFVDAGTFAVAAALVTLIRVPARARPVVADGQQRPTWRADLREGVAWLWRHRFLRHLAITLGVMNLLTTMASATFVLFCQEVLGTNTREYAVLTIIAAVGAVVGGWVAGAVVGRLGVGPTLRTVMTTFVVIAVLFASNSSWVVAALLLVVEYFAIVVWNVITVSLRQTLIPDRLLGRVNSVYRFFGWGMIPVGALLGGLIVAFADGPVSRETALRLPHYASAALMALLLVGFALTRLTTAAAEAAKAETSAVPTPEPTEA